MQQQARCIGPLFFASSTRQCSTTAQQQIKPTTGKSNEHLSGWFFGCAVFIGSAQIWAHGKSRSQQQGEIKGKKINRTGVESLVLRQQNGQWQIVLVHWS